MSMTNGFADVQSDEHGNFVVPAIAVGRLGIYACVDAGLPVLPQILDYTKHPIEVRPGETTKIEIPLVTAVSLRGSVPHEGHGQTDSQTLD